jgi:hypothetical protein
MLKRVVDKNKKVDLGAMRQSARSAASSVPVLKKITTDLEIAASNLAESNKGVEQAETDLLDLMKHAHLVNPAELALYKQQVEEQRQTLVGLVDKSKIVAKRLDEVASKVPTSVPPEATGYFSRLKQGVKDIYTNHGKSIMAAAVIIGAAATLYYSQNSGVNLETLVKHDDELKITDEIPEKIVLPPEAGPSHQLLLAPPQQLLLAPPQVAPVQQYTQEQARAALDALKQRMAANALNASNAAAATAAFNLRQKAIADELAAQKAADDLFGVGK